MRRVKLGSILTEQRNPIGLADGNNLDLIGVSNKIGLKLSTAKRIADLSRYQKIEHGWFAYNPMRVNVGSIGYAFDDTHIGIVSPDYIVFSCSEDILPEYLLFLLKSDEGIEAINKNASGAVRKRLYFSDLAKIEVVLPDIDKQKKRLIAFNEIEDLNDSISEQLTKESLLSKLKQSILQEAIQGKLTKDWRKNNPKAESARELLGRIYTKKAQLVKDKKIKNEKALPPITEEEIPFQLPKRWAWCKLGEIIINTNNLDIQKKLNPNDIINYVDIEAIDNKTQKIKAAKQLPVRELSSRARRVLKKGQILYSLVRPYLNNLAIVNEEKENFIGSTGFVVFDCLLVRNEYVFWILLSKYIEDLYLGYMDGFNSPSITHEQFKNTVIPFPPASEQNAIIEKVEGLMKKCNSLEQEIQNSQAHAQMLMQAVLTEAFQNN